MEEGEMERLFEKTYGAAESRAARAAFESSPG